MRSKPSTSRHQRNHASSSRIAASGSFVSLRTKKWKRSSVPARWSERWMAFRPAKTRSTGSLQIGITTAVGMDGPSTGGAVSGWSRLVMAKRSRFRASVQKPRRAVQKPIEIQPKRAPKKIMMAISSPSAPLCGSTFAMKPLATTEGIRTRIMRKARRRCATRVHGSRRRSWRSGLP
jgi:hypothetical protein